MKHHLLIKLFFVMFALIFIVSCSKSKSVEGTYTITKSPGQAMVGYTVTLGKNTCVFSFGRNGTYEVSDGKVIFSVENFPEVMKIEGNKLINDKYTMELKE